MALNTSGNVRGKILAYFGHSYRPEDRDVNCFFWDLFHDEGIFFTVDPQSKFLSIPYLESMMVRSNCFVAVIPRRDTPLGCSPYILFEYGLALETQKPALVFVEQDVDSSRFPNDRERIVPFNRKRLADNKDEFIRAIHLLANKVRGYRNPDVRLAQPCGLVVRTGTNVGQIYTPALIQSLRMELLKLGRRLQIVKLEFDAAFEFCLELEKYDFLIMEVRDSLWLAGYVLGRAIPSIKVCYVSPEERCDPEALPSIISRHKPEQTNEQPVIFWQQQEELLEGVSKHVSKFNTERREFHTKEDGLRYFKQAGRREAKVFISNANVSNVLVRELTAELERERIDFFHYKIRDAILVGDRWAPEIERQIRETGVFIALITTEFLQSKWCMHELQAARKREKNGELRIHPYLLEPGLWDKVTLLGLDEKQVKDLTTSDEATSIQAIVEDLDRELKRKDSRPGPAVHTPKLTPEQQNELRDLLLEFPGTKKPEQREALLFSLPSQIIDSIDLSGDRHAAIVRLVETLEGWGQLADGRWATEVMLRNALSLAQSTQFEQRFEAIRQTFDGPAAVLSEVDPSSS
jgi:hypothetical protein